MKKKLLRLRSDAEAEAFVDKADLTEFDLSEMRELRFEFDPERGNNLHPSLDGKGSSAAGRAGGVKIPECRSSGVHPHPGDARPGPPRKEEV